MKQRIFAAGALASLGLAGPLSGPLLAQDYKATRLVKTIDGEALAAIAEGLGHTVETKRTEGTQRVVAVTADSLKYVMSGTACNEDTTACKGILMQVVYSDASAVTDADIIRANNERVAVTAWVDRDDDQYGFSRYLILDEGMTMGNIRRSIEVLLAVQEYSAKVARGEDEKTQN